MKPVGYYVKLTLYAFFYLELGGGTIKQTGESLGMYLSECGGPLRMWQGWGTGCGVSGSLGCSWGLRGGARGLADGGAVCSPPLSGQQWLNVTTHTLSHTSSIEIFQSLLFIKVIMGVFFGFSHDFGSESFSSSSGTRRSVGWAAGPAFRGKKVLEGPRLQADIIASLAGSVSSWGYCKLNYRAALESHFGSCQKIEAVRGLI